MTSESHHENREEEIVNEIPTGVPGADPDRGESGLSHGQIFPLRIFRG